MATVRKVLAQSTPSAATSTTLYTCPSATDTVISFISVCNRSTTPTSYRLGIDVDAAGDHRLEAQDDLGGDGDRADQLVGRDRVRIARNPDNTVFRSAPRHLRAAQEDARLHAAALRGELRAGGARRRTRGCAGGTRRRGELG